MGVYATFCEVCGLPVQRDHYVTPNGEPLSSYDGRVRIWRADDPSPPAVSFAERHAWLDEAVAPPADPEGGAVLEGQVHDGHLWDAEGERHEVDDQPVLHRACWERLGQPRSWNPAGELPKNAALAPFQLQLFDFAGLVAAGLGDWLEDPRGPALPDRPREWMQSQADIYAGKKPSPVVRLPTLVGVLEAAVAAKADTVILAPGRPPVLRQKQVVLAHAFPAWPFEHWRRQVFAMLDERTMREVFGAGDGMTQVKLAGIGPVKLYVHYVMPESECTARVLLGAK